MSSSPNGEISPDNIDSRLMLWEDSEWFHRRFLEHSSRLFVSASESLEVMRVSEDGRIESVTFKNNADRLSQLLSVGAPI